MEGTKDRLNKKDNTYYESAVPYSCDSVAAAWGLGHHDSWKTKAAEKG